MKNEFYFAGIILIALCFLLFFFYIRIKREQHKNLMDEITKLATQNNLQISKFDMCGNMIIAIDERKGHILFFKLGKTENISKIVNLTDIERCKVSNHYKKDHSENKTNDEEDQMGILFKPYNSNKPEVYICFKNKEDKKHVSKRFMLTYKWSYMINNRIFAMR
jgi:hypothetical protein